MGQPDNGEGCIEMNIIHEIEEEATAAARCIVSGDPMGAMVCINAIIGMAQEYSERLKRLDELVEIAQKGKMGY